MALKLKKVYLCYYLSLVLGLVLLCMYSNVTTTSNSYDVRGLTEEMRLMEEISVLISDVQGDDYRIMRWDATEHTIKRQNEGGCTTDNMKKSIDLILADKLSDQLRARAAQYLTFCITDNNENRAFLSQQDGIHTKIVEMVKLPLVQRTKTFVSSTSEIDATSLASAMASHLIYIASFNNQKNHVAFENAGAVPALSAIIKDKNQTPIQIMWAAAALQNLAATYCSTTSGRCRWDWTEDDDELIIVEKALPITVDGSTVRKTMMDDIELIDTLLQYACSGPVTSDPLPGKSGTVHRDELSKNLIPWGATGALKNLAILLEARHYIVKQNSSNMACFCQLSHSRDWLEVNKGEGLLYMLRRNDPCWFADPRVEYMKEAATSETELCVDGDFYDNEGYTCSNYDEEPSEADCLVKDRHGYLAKDACCPCGGGERVNTNKVQEVTESVSEASN
jgi:hypothetical protein